MYWTECIFVSFPAMIEFVFFENKSFLQRKDFVAESQIKNFLNTSKNEKKITFSRKMTAQQADYEGLKQLAFHEARDRAAMIFLKFIDSQAREIKSGNRYEKVRGFDYGQRISTFAGSRMMSWNVARLFSDPDDFAFLQRLVYEDHGLYLLNIRRGDHRMELALFPSLERATHFVEKAFQQDPDCFPHGQTTIPIDIRGSEVKPQRRSTAKFESKSFSLDVSEFPALQ